MTQYERTHQRDALAPSIHHINDDLKILSLCVSLSPKAPTYSLLASLVGVKSGRKKKSQKRKKKPKKVKIDNKVAGSHEKRSATSSTGGKRRASRIGFNGNKARRWRGLRSLRSSLDAGRTCSGRQIMSQKPTRRVIQEKMENYAIGVAQ